MTAVLTWYFVVQCLGTSAFLLARPCFRRLPDAGYAVSKSLGVLMCGLALWLGTALGLMRNEAGGAALAFAALAATAALVGRRSPAPHLRLLVASEVIFGAAFGGWCLVRSFSPAANHTEQPMDLMLLTAVSISPSFPPADPWLSGYPAGYYYLGYWLMSTLGFLTGQPPELSYTLGQACWFALLVLGCFGLGFNLAALTWDDSVHLRGPIAAGALTALVVALTSNLHAPVEWATAWMDGSPSPFAESGWWWWRSSRAVQDLGAAGNPIQIITEFPFFSYLLGDNHPHLLAMPFVVLVLVCGLSLLVERGAYSRSPQVAVGPVSSLKPRVVLSSSLWLAIVVVGSLAGMNTWDLPAALLLTVLVASWPFGVGATPGAVVRRAAWTTVAAVAAILVVYFPYVVTAQSQVKGVLPNLFHPTSLSQFITVFGTLAPGLALLVHLAWVEAPPARWPLVRRLAVVLMASGVWLTGAAVWAARSEAGHAWIASVAPGVERPMMVALDRWMAGWPVLAIVAAALVVVASLACARLTRGRPSADSLTFGLLLSGIGLALVLGPELVYVHDNFANRMNTVFKLYYQAWLYLAVAGSLGIALSWRRGGLPRAGALAALALLACGLPYPVAALRATTREASAGTPTLDALGFLRQQSPDEFAAIQWVRTNTPRTAVIAQAPGESYRAGDSRLSATTGRPTLLGWQGHERQWRGAAFETMAAGRLEALGRIYNPSSPEALQQTLDAWRIDYVQVGPLERARYGMTTEHESVVAGVMELAFERGAVRLYRRRG